jgi:hypothetical protein
MTMPNDTNAAAPAEMPGAGDESRTGSGAREQIRQVKDQVVDQAKDSFRQARDSATSSLAHSRQQAADRVGSIASAFRSASDHLRSEHQAGVANLTDSLAEQVETSAPSATTSRTSRGGSRPWRWAPRWRRGCWSPGSSRARSALAAPAAGSRARGAGATTST